jgi:hypothetical protein
MKVMGNMRRKTILSLLWIALMAAFLSMQMGCSSGGDDTVTGEGGGSGGGSSTVSSLEIASGSESIVADGSSQARISVTLMDSEGEKVKDGVVVGFSTTAGDFNRSSPGIQTTTSAASKNGVAYAMLTSSSNVGTATVTASVQGINGTTQVNFVPSSVSQIALTASPSNLTASSASTSTVTAFVTDPKGNSVADGETISFRLSGPGKLSVPTARTSNGVAEVTYTAANDIGTATITAISTSGTVRSSVEISLIRAIVGSVTFASPSATLPADGISRITLTALVTDTGDSPVEDGTAVNFTTTAGTFVSAAQALQTGQTGKQTAIAYTVNGRASVSLVSTTKVGVATVTATAGGISGTMSVNFVAGIPNRMTMDVSPKNLTADGTSTANVRVFVTDSNGNAVQTSEVISFFVNSGSGSMSPPTATLSQGVATSVYKAGRTPGSVTISASTTSGISATETLTLINVGVGSISVSSGSAQIIADGRSQTAITARVRDQNGQNVPDGTAVTFSTTAGTLSSNGIAGTSGGLATVTLTSSRNAGRATVTGTSGGFSGTVSVEFVAGSPRQIILSASPESIVADGRSISTIRADVTDSQGNPVADGELVVFAIESGTGSLGPPVSVRTIGGVAQTNFTASNQPGVTRVRAETVTGNAATVDVVLLSPDVGTITVNADPPSIVANGQSQSVITATVKFQNGDKAYDGTPVIFTTTGGRFFGGGTETTERTVGGSASVKLVSSTVPGTARVTAKSGGVSGAADVSFTAIAGFLSLSTDKTTVKSDNSDSATITATVLDANRVPIPNVMVNFRTTINGTVQSGGQISASAVETDDKGEAKVIFSSGTVEKKNQTVIIEATIPSVPDLGTRQIPIQIVGTTVELSTTKTELETGDSVDLVITVRDAGNVTINDAPVTIDVDNPSVASVSRTTGTTNVNGQLTVRVTGVGAGEATVGVSSLGAYKEQAYRVGTTGAVFRIISPAEDPYSLSTNTPVTIEVLVPPIAGGNEPDEVRFATSLGYFTDGGGTDNVIDRTVSGGTATATFVSTIPGVANIQAFNLDNPSVKDAMSIVVSAPSAEAAKIALQASSTVVAPSTGDTKNSVTLRATVKTASDQVVGGAAVAFSIVNPTGGGETISPVISFTDGFGVATSTFTSGFISSDSQGVRVTAEIIGTGIFDQVAIVIGGTAGSIQIGRGTKIESINNNAAYSLPMVAVVSDANGNPVSGAVITLGNWPVGYAVGYWVELDNKCKPTFLQPVVQPPATIPAPPGYPQYPGDYAPEYVLNSAYYFSNEDLNRNLILDPGEDRNGDGQLTPSSSSAGTLPPTVTTDANGVAEFSLVYAKGSAIWIKTAVSASTLVLGTETKASYEFILPALEGEECNLPNSPYTAPPWPWSLTSADVLIDTAELGGPFGDLMAESMQMVNPETSEAIGTDNAQAGSASSATDASSAGASKRGSGSAAPGGTASAVQVKISSDVLNLPGLAYTGREASLTVSVSGDTVSDDSSSANGLRIGAETGLSLESTAVNPDESGVARVTARTEMPESVVAPAPDDVKPEPWETALLDYVNASYGEAFSGHPTDGLCSVSVFRDTQSGEPVETLPILLTGEPLIRFDAESVAVNNGGSQTLNVLVCDRNLNPLAAGAKVSITADSGSLEGKTTYTFKDGNIVGPDQEGQLSRIELPIVLSDADASDNQPPAPATVTVTVDWEGVRYRSQLKGTVD